MTDANLTWLTDALWGTGAVRSSSDPSPPPGFRPLETFAVIPSRSRPHLLIPLSSPNVAYEALCQFSSATSPPMRVARAMMGIGLRLDPVRRILPDRLHVFAPRDREDTWEERSLHEHLRGLFGRGDILMAITIGTVRPNRKPVIQVLSSDAEVLGYVKVGWNKATRRLVRNEASVLAAFMSERPPVQFSVPRLLHAGSFEGLELLAVAPVPRGRFPVGKANLGLPYAATEEVAGRKLQEQHALAESGYWKRARDRMTLAREAAPGISADAVAGIMDRIEERVGQVELSFGSWHGDWTPWNMGYVGDRLFVWDWERSGDTVPVGLDALHFHFHIDLKLRRKTAQAAARACIPASRPYLKLLGVPDGLEPLLLSLHLLEMSLRYEEGRASGLDLGNRAYLDALRHVLTAYEIAPLRHV